MSNIHGLFSSSNNNNNNNSNNSSDDDQDDENNRYVGGIGDRGGGSGLAVQPNPEHNVLDSIRAVASEQTSGDEGRVERRITMYASGFTVDNGPYRRLDDPANSDFLRALSIGRTPPELLLTDDDDEAGGATRSEGNIVVGLIDKRSMEYEDDKERQSGAGGGVDGSGGGFQSFGGTGQSLGGADGDSSNNDSSDGLITPSSDDAPPPEVDEQRPTTSILIRLLNGKRLKVKVNCDSPVSVLSQHISASPDGGSDSYVLSSGYPPQILKDLTMSVEDAGLKGAQVMQKKA